jgi:hypothetical protein
MSSHRISRLVCTLATALIGCSSSNGHDDKAESELTTERHSTSRLSSGSYDLPRSDLTIYVADDDVDRDDVIDGYDDEPLRQQIHLIGRDTSCEPLDVDVSTGQGEVSSTRSGCEASLELSIVSDGIEVTGRAAIEELTDDGTRRHERRTIQGTFVKRRPNALAGRYESREGESLVVRTSDDTRITMSLTDATGTVELDARTSAQQGSRPADSSLRPIAGAAYYVDVSETCTITCFVNRLDTGEFGIYLIPDVGCDVGFDFRTFWQQ